MQGFNEKVYAIVAQIPRGMVMSYGQIARLAGNPMASRAVGYAMHALTSSDAIPCHRVVFKDGSLSPAFENDMQYKLLKKEKVSFTTGHRVDMMKHRWNAYGLRGDFF